MCDKTEMDATEWSSIVLMLAITGYGFFGTLLATLITMAIGISVISFLWKS